MNTNLSSLSGNIFNIFYNATIFYNIVVNKLEKIKRRSGAFKFINYFNLTWEYVYNEWMC